MRRSVSFERRFMEMCEMLYLFPNVNIAYDQLFDGIDRTENNQEIVKVKAGGNVRLLFFAHFYSYF